MLEAKHVQSKLKWSTTCDRVAHPVVSWKRLLKTRNLIIENRVIFVTWVNTVKASGPLPGMYRLVTVLCKGYVGMLWRLAVSMIKKDQKDKKKDKKDNWSTTSTTNLGMHNNPGTHKKGEHSQHFLILRSMVNASPVLELVSSTYYWNKIADNLCDQHIYPLCGPQHISSLSNTAGFRCQSSPSTPLLILSAQSLISLGIHSGL